MVLATDAPLSDRNLTRLARRALTGLARTGSTMSNGSGDYVISFSTAESVRRSPSNGYCASIFDRTCVRKASQGVRINDVPNEKTSPLFAAAIEATEEAILNAMFKATSVRGYDASRGKAGELRAIPVDKVIEIYQSYRPREDKQ